MQKVQVYQVILRVFRSRGTVPALLFAIATNIIDTLLMCIGDVWACVQLYGVRQ